MTADRPTTEPRRPSAIALDRLMAVINERTTIEPRHRPAIRASLRAYRRAIEAEASAEGWNRANETMRALEAEAAQGAAPRGYVDSTGMYHLTAPEYNAALRRAYKDGLAAPRAEGHTHNPDACDHCMALVMIGADRAAPRAEGLDSQTAELLNALAERSIYSRGDLEDYLLDKELTGG